jgi:hypothetical protein
MERKSDRFSGFAQIKQVAGQSPVPPPRALCFAATWFSSRIFRKDFLTFAALKQEGLKPKSTTGVMMKTGEIYDPNAQSLQERIL